MAIFLKKTTIFDIDGRMLIGTITKKSSDKSFLFAPKVETIINRMNSNGTWSAYAIDKLIEELELLKDFMSAQEIAEELSGQNGNGEIKLEP
ncbi:MAG: hypothetical protein K0R18_49 [Bacillales bacterium]|jgi:hypothetical protein|nr:hypothetical protein [Bacillales bacterium]